MAAGHEHRLFRGRLRLRRSFCGKENRSTFRTLGTTLRFRSHRHEEHILHSEILVANREAMSLESELRTEWDAVDLLRTTVSDWVKFLISVMENKQLTKGIVHQRFIITRNLIAPEREETICEASVHPEQRHVSAGFGLGRHVVNIDGEIIADHTEGVRGAPVMKQGSGLAHASVLKVEQATGTVIVFPGSGDTVSLN